MSEHSAESDAGRLYGCSGCGNLVSEQGGWCGGCWPAPDWMTPLEVVVHVLRNEGGEPGSSLHSWRCEHPDRYGACTCLAEIAQEVLDALGTRVTSPGEGRSG